MASSSFPWSFQSDAQVVVRLGKVGLQLQRPAVTGDRLGRLPLVLEGIAQVVVASA